MEPNNLHLNRKMSSKNAKSMFIGATVAGLSALAGWKIFEYLQSKKQLTKDELAIVEMLKGLGQTHLFEGWEEADLADKKRLAAQLALLHTQYPDGMLFFFDCI